MPGRRYHRLPPGQFVRCDTLAIGPMLRQSPLLVASRELAWAPCPALRPAGAALFSCRTANGGPAHHYRRLPFRGLADLTRWMTAVLPPPCAPREHIWRIMAGLWIVLSASTSEVGKKASRSPGLLAVCAIACESDAPLLLYPGPLHQSNNASYTSPKVQHTSCCCPRRSLLVQPIRARS